MVAIFSIPTHASQLTPESIVATIDGLPVTGKDININLSDPKRIPWEETSLVMRIRHLAILNRIERETGKVTPSQIEEWRDKHIKRYSHPRQEKQFAMHRKMVEALREYVASPNDSRAIYERHLKGQMSFKSWSSQAKYYTTPEQVENFARNVDPRDRYRRMTRWQIGIQILEERLKELRPPKIEGFLSDSDRELLMELGETMIPIVADTLANPPSTPEQNAFVSNMAKMGVLAPLQKELKEIWEQEAFDAAKIVLKTDRYSNIAPRVRNEGKRVQPLRDLKEPRTIKEAVRRIRSRETTSGMRVLAQLRLMKAGRQAVPALLDCIKDTSGYGFHSCVILLQWNKAKEAIPHLISALHSNRMAVDGHQYVMHALISLGGEDIVPKLKDFVSARDVMYLHRPIGITAIAEIQKKRSIPYLRQLLRYSEDPIPAEGWAREKAIKAGQSVRLRAAFELARFGDDSGYEVAIDALKTEQPSETGWAIKILRLLKKQGSVALLRDIAQKGQFPNHAALNAAREIEVSALNPSAQIDYLERALGSPADQHWASQELFRRGNEGDKGALGLLKRISEDKSHSFSRNATAFFARRRKSEAAGANKPPDRRSGF